MPIYSNFKERILQTNSYNDIQFYPSGTVAPLDSQPGGITRLMVALCSGSLGNINHAETIYVNHQEAGFGSVGRNEVSGPGYLMGGKPILNVTGERQSNGRVVISGSPVVWSGLTASFRYAVIYVSGVFTRSDGPFTGLDGVIRNTSNDYWSYLVAHIDLGQQNVVSSDFTINWNTQGILIFD
jgi:hypothetical protein